MAVRESMEGDPTATIRILESLQNAENDVIVQSLLATAYLEAGDYWGYYHFPVVQGRLEPNTSYEKLFAGRAMFWPDFKQSIDHLNDAVEQTASPLSLTYRSLSTAFLASSRRADEEKTLELERLIDRAVFDADTATHLFHARHVGGEEIIISPTVQSTHLLVLVHAYDIYERLAVHFEQQGRIAKAAQAREKAETVMVSADSLYTALSKQDLTKLDQFRSWMGFYLAHPTKAYFF